MPIAPRFNVKETKVSSYVAGNGLELQIDKLQNRVTIRFAGKILGENLDLGLLAQSGRMLSKLAPESRFVCDLHGPYMKKPGHSQDASCQICVNAAIDVAGSNMEMSTLDSDDDA